RLHLVLVAEHAVHFGHIHVACWIELYGAARGDNMGVRVFAPQFAQHLQALALGLFGHGAGIDDDGVAQAGVARVGAHHFAFVGIEPAAQAHNPRALIARLQRGHASKLASRVPAKDWATGPVMITWPSARHSICRSPPSRVTVTLRSVKPRRAAATAD